MFPAIKNITHEFPTVNDKKATGFYIKTGQEFQLPDIYSHRIYEENNSEYDEVTFTNGFVKIPKKESLTSSQRYLNKCKKHGITPVNRITDFFQSESTILNMHQKTLSIAQFQVLFGLLRNYKNIYKLNLNGTNIQMKCLNSLERFLCQNHYITNLDLSNNLLHGKGARVLNNALASPSNKISRLNLRSTGLKDSDLKILEEAFTTSNTLLRLNLSHNKLQEQSGHTIGDILQFNCHLEKFDISWNSIRNSGACAVATGLANNGNILYFNASFNGFGNEGAKEIGNALQVNKILIGLDLSENRITDTGARDLSRGISTNETLKVLDISANLITSYGASYILSSIIQTMAIKELYMNHISPDSLCMEAITYLQGKSPNMVINHGVTCSTTVTKLSHDKTIVNAELFDLIRHYLAKERLRMLDLFKIWDKSKRGYLTHDELTGGLISCGINTTKAMLEQLFKRLDSDESGTIEYYEFAAISKLE